MASENEEYELFGDGRDINSKFKEEMSEVAKVVVQNPHKTFLVIDQSGLMIEMRKAERMDGLPLFLYDLCKHNQILQQKIKLLESENAQMKSIQASLWDKHPK